MNRPHFHLVIFTLLILILLFIPASTCDCLNEGKCYIQSKPHRCICPQSFIGDKCQLSSRQINDKSIQQSLTQNFTYFHFQPDQTNYYQLIFTICMKKNSRNAFTYFYYEIERDDGSINISPSIFQTAKFHLDNNVCINFTTHYVSINKRQDSSYKKIIVGLKKISEDEASQQSFFNYLLSESSFRDENKVDKQVSKVKQMDQLIIDEQLIRIQVNYQVYIKNQYSNTFIIIFTSASLLLILLSFAIFLNNKYRSHSESQIETQSHILNFSNHWGSNPEQFRNRFKFDNLNHIDIFMPITLYDNSNQKNIVEGPLMTMGQFQSREEDDQQCCSICLQQFQLMDYIRRTPCNHFYHSQCIDNWFETQMSCPVCRRKVDFTRQMRRLQYQILCRQLLK